MLEDLQYQSLLEKLLQFGETWWLHILIGLVALLVLPSAYRRIRRAIRRRRPVKIHPKMQIYVEGVAGPIEPLSNTQRAEAERIIATSSGPAIAGYEIIEQVEAVCVDGFRRPEEAVLGLKAAAAMKGANAVTNVRTERDARNKCIASGDAVMVRRTKQPPEAGEQSAGGADRSSGAAP